MKTAVLRLESFDSDPGAQNDMPVTPHEVENLRTRAFEEGYGAGWADALEQMRNEDALRRGAAEEALQAISFSYHEACAALEASFVDLVAQIVSVILPSLKGAALPQHLDRELRALAAKNFGQRLELLCAPSVMHVLAERAAAVAGLEVALQEEPSFSEAQVLLRCDQTTRMIDLDAVIVALKAGADAPSDQKEASYG
ncbi:MAG: hypothetical protein JXQ79_00740 [Rhodobacteraceae bacterium]|nr:hypothetical protein [Paracoccaceae bacterium]